MFKHTSSWINFIFFYFSFVHDAWKSICQIWSQNTWSVRYWNKRLHADIDKADEDHIVGGQRLYNSLELIILGRQVCAQEASVKRLVLVAREAVRAYKSWYFHESMDAVFRINKQKRVKIKSGPKRWGLVEPFDAVEQPAGLFLNWQFERVRLSDATSEGSTDVWLEHVVYFGRLGLDELFNATRAKERSLPTWMWSLAADW